MIIKKDYMLRLIIMLYWLFNKKFSTLSVSFLIHSVCFLTYLSTVSVSKMIHSNPTYPPLCIKNDTLKTKVIHILCIKSDTLNTPSVSKVIHS